MGNEASLEGGGQPGEVGSAGSTVGTPASISAPPGSGQLTKPSNGGAAGAGPAAGAGARINSHAGRPSQADHGAGAGGGGGGGGGSGGRVDPYRLATHESPRQQPPSPGQVQAPRRSLQVDISQKAGGRSPLASPDRGSAATSPYSVPQIAPMPSSRLCPVCNTTDLTASQDQPNFNTCTQCRAMVCNQCGFNPNPHLTEVQEWLCLNCQMQRALGMDMTTPPRSKSQQQIHSPSHQAKPEPQAQHPSQAQPSQPSPGPNRQTGPRPASQPGPPAGSQHPRPDQAAQRVPTSQAQPTLDPLGRRDQPGLAKAPSQPDLSRSSPQHHRSRPAGTDQVRSAGSSPARAPGGPQEPSQDGLTGKLFGFGASLLNQASTLISVDPQPTTQPQQSPAKASPKVVFSDASSAAAPKPQGAMPGATQAKQGGTPPLQQQQQRQPPAKQDATPKPKEPEKPKVSCPLCKTELNMGSAQPPNYNSCTQCGSQVCNLCGFNPTPHLLEKKEWLCLNCQTQRLLSGGLGDAPLPVPQPSPKHQPAGSPRHQPAAARQQPAPTQPPQKGASPQHGPKAAPPQQKLPASAGSGPFSPAKHHAAPVQDKPAAGATGEAQKQQLLAEKDRMMPRPGREADPPAASKESKPAPKKGAPEPITAITPAKESKKPGESQKTKHHDEALKSSTQDLSRSPQSLSDTGYSSDGISSSQSEITGLIHEEEMKLSERGAGEHSPPSPSEITKLESSMRPLLESKSISDGDQKGRGKQHHHHDPRDDPKQKQRPRSLSITPEAFDSDEELEDILEEDEDSVEWENQHARRDSLAESSDDFGSKLRHDYVEDSSESGFSPLPGRQRKTDSEMTDEEFMRRQILEMSAEEDNMDEDEGYGYPKQKKSHKHSTDSGKDSKRRLPHNSSSLYEEEVKVHEDGYKAAVEDGEEDLMASQGGLRRFKTIELNNTNSYSREMELSSENDLSLDREPELEMESLTGSPDERSRGEYSSTLPATTPSYTSGTSPTSVSSMEEDSDSSPSRRQRLEEAKQQRKARHRSHGPLLPTIEDSSEEEELREEEELLREQEKMREVEQQRIRSTARKTKRDKEELRAQRRRERSKTPPSNLSPIEDASPTEELRQAAEMEELHRSSCSEYSPSIDSEAEGFEMIASKLYKSGSEYNLPTFMSLYSPTEKPTTTSSSSSSKPLKSAEEVYEEMMRKAEMLQKQQKQQMQQVKQGQQYSNTYQQEDFRSTGHQNNYQYQYEEDYGYEKEMGTAHPGYQSTASKADNIYEEILQTSQSISKMQQSSSLDMSLQQKESSQTNLCGSFQDKQLLDTGSAFAKLLEQNSALLTPGTSPTQLSAPVSFSSTGTETSGTGARAIPDVRVTQHFSKEMQKDRARSQSSSVSVGSTGVTTVASYVVYGRESTATTHTSTGQTAASTSPSAGYGRQTGSVAAGSAVSSRISEYAQAYSQRDSSGKRAGESKGTQVRDSSQGAADNVNFTSKVYSYFKGSSPPLSPYTSPTQSPTHSPSRMATAEFSTQTFGSGTSVPMTGSGATSPVVAQGTQTPHRSMSPRLSRQQSSQESPFMVITLGSEATSPSKPLTVNSSTSPLSSPTRLSRQQTLHGYGQSAGPLPSPQHQQQQQQQSQHVLYKTQTQTDRGPVAKVNVGTSTVTTANTYSRGSLSMENISLCRISTVPGTSRVEQGQRMPSGSVVDLRTATKPAPVIMTDQGMDLTSVATESRKFSVGSEASPTRHSTTVQPLIMNLNAQQHPRVAMSTATTVSITVAASMFISQPKQPVVYGDPFQNRLDFGQGSGSAVCLTQGKKQTDQLIPKIDAKLEDLGIQQQQLQQQQKQLQQQQQQLEHQLQQHHQQQQQLQQQQATFARYNLANQVQPLHKKDMMVSQTNTAQAVVSVSAIPRASPVPDQAGLTGAISAPPHDLYSGVPLELKGQPPIVNLSGVKPHVMMVQLDNTSQGATVTQLVKPGEAPDALDLTGIKSENQVACCDVVYKFPFGGSCTGPFAQKPKVPEKTHVPVSEPPQSSRPPSAPQYYGSRAQEASQENYQYREQLAGSHGLMDERKPYPLPFPGRLHPSMSDTNLAEAGLHYYQTKTDTSQRGPVDMAVDLSTMKQSYGPSFSEGGYFGLGMQYGSYTDLRHQGDMMSQPLPIRRYSSMSNINADYSYSSRDLSSFQESNLAQYSATTAREISRMCAALNSIDQFGGRFGTNPELMQYGSAGGGAAGSRFGLLTGQQGLPSMKANLMYGSNLAEGRLSAHVQGQASLAQYNARQASIRAMYPSAVRAADGMIYSTINTPIASTLPITTQPASVLRPMLRGLYRPYPTGNMTAVPLASLTRLPLVTPRMPLSSQGPYRYPPPNRFPVAPAAASVAPATTALETPVYLGKPSVTSGVSSTTPLASSLPITQPTSHMGVPNAQAGAAPATALPMAQPVVVPTSQQQPQIHLQAQLPAQQQPHLQAAQPQTQHQTQPQSQPQLQQPPSQPPAQPQTPSQAQTQTQAPAAPLAAAGMAGGSTEKEKEEERLRRQQEHLLQFERERVELEKLRQLRLQEELERERLELQRHREKEQLLVQREIQELQTIKQQVLQQQQAERETQLVMQREQLAQQKMQLDQIQSLQQQLQQQLEEQKRQKAAAAAATVGTTAPGAIQGVAVVGASAPQGYSIVCDQTGRLIQQEVPCEMQRTMGQNGQFWQPFVEGGVIQGVMPPRPLPSSASEMSLRNEEHMEVRAMKKRNSMPRLRDGVEFEENQHSVKRIADSSVQTDDEDGEERFYMSRRRRTRRIVDCSVQTDDEDNGEWEQPVRRRRSRFSKHSDSGSESKAESSKGTSSIAIQTISDCSCQTEPDQLGRVSPAIHITTHDPKVEIVHYISAPERTQKGESLACQTEPEAQSQGVVVPQLTVPTTITPYSTNIQLVGSGPVDPLSPRLQGVAKFEKRKPDPLEIGYQSHHLHNESLSNLIRQPPKSPQVLYSPVSPLSPHRLLETSFSSSERLNKAHVTPQKHFTAESPQRQQTLPRPIKTMQRSMSDPKPISPTTEDPTKAKFSLYQQQALQNSQLSALQQNTLIRKVKRTLPSPPPEEAHLPVVTLPLPQMYAPTMPQKAGPRPVQANKASLLKDITHELKVVEQESTKLRKQQAELEEEEKEIDAKLRYLELGITQRKETLLKERERRELAYMRCMGDTRDYMSDSELNNMRIATTYEGNGLLTRPSTAPLNQYNELTTAQYPPTTSFVTYQYPQTQTAPQATTTYQQTGFQPPQYPPVTNAQPQPNTFQTHHPPPPYQTQGTFPPHNYTPNQPYQPDLGVQNHPGFQPPPAPYQTQATYPSQTSFQPGQNIPFQPQAEILTVHQKPRQTSLADLEQKLPTNYEVISNPTVVVTSAGQEVTYTPTTVTNNYGQYKPPETTLSDRINTAESPTSAYSSEGLYTNLEQNIPRNYVMIDDISELTKENVGTSSDMQKADIHGHSTNGRYGKDRCDTGENGSSTRVSSYSRAEEESEEDLYDHHGRSKNSSSYHQRGGDSHSRMGSSSSGGGGSSYYYDDYKHSSRSSDKHGSSMGIQKHSSKNLAPAVVSSKRSKHRKQSMEQKISKFSPIEEAKDVESDMASYTITTSSGGSCNVMTRAKKLQDEITYGLKKNVYDQQKYYGMSSREALEEDDHIYSTGRSRSTGYGMDKISSRDSGNHRSKSYERDTMERSQRGSHSRGRPSMRSQHSEEESPLSPLGKPMGVGRGSGVPEPPDSRNQFGSSHSLPDVQDHMKDIPRSHAYKPDDAYIIDDMHCAVSDSEAYHLGQEETDWFEKPRELRSERSRHYGSSSGGGGGHSSSQRRNHVKHTYHDYDEPPDEDLWQQDDYSHPRHSSSSSREHRHHGSNSGRHSSSSRHSSEEARSSRSSKGHPKESSVRHESRQAASSSSQKRSQPADSRSLQGYHSSDYSRQPSSHHHSSSEGQRMQKQPPSSHHQQPQQQQQQLQSSRKQDHQAASSRQQPSSQQQPSSRQPQSQPQAGRLPASQQQQQQQQEGLQQQGQQGQQARSQQQQQQGQGQGQAQASVVRQPQMQQQQQQQQPVQQQPAQAQQQQAKPGQAQVQAQAQAPAPAPAQARPPQAGLQPAAAAKTNLADAAKPGVKPAAQPAKAPQGPTTAIGAKAVPRPGGQAAADGESVFSKILPGGAAEQAGKLGEAVSAFGKKFTSFW